MYSWTTYPERLLKAGVSFKFYHQQADGTGVDQIHPMKQYLELPTDSELYRRTIATSPVGQFQYDAMNDQLPTVSWIFPPSGLDEHPANLPAAGANFVSGIVDAIAADLGHEGPLHPLRWPCLPERMLAA